MESTIPMREIAKLGKRVLISVIGIADNYKELRTVDPSQSPKCQQCPFQHIDSVLRDSYCNTCEVKQEVIYRNERHSYKLSQEDRKKRLSRYQLLQFLLYHFMSVDSNGFLRYISVKRVAEILGCSLRTVRNNNDILQQLNLISFGRIDSEYINIYLPEYKQYHLTKEEGGTGYLQLSKEFFTELLCMTHVNSIRLALRQHLVFDNDVHVQQRTTCTTSYNDMKRFMPKNVTYPKILLAMMKPTEVLFDIEATESTISLRLKEIYDGKHLKETKEQSFEAEINHFFAESDEPLLPTEVIDLVSLSMEYGISSVMNALQLYRTFHTDQGIRNLGGFIRERIRDTIYPRFAA